MSAFIVLAGLLGGGAAARADAGALGPAPKEYSIASWSTEDGLPANSVTALAQTRDGYVWVGTPLGLARFDGVRFKVFNQANCPALPSSQVVALFEVGQGTLLVSTAGGGLVAVHEGHFTRLFETGIENDYVASCLKVAADEWLLVGSWGALWRWRDERLETISTERGFGPINGRTVARDKQGRVWMLANQGLGPWRVVRLEGDKFKAVELGGALEGGQCGSLASDVQGGLWLGTSRGLAHMTDGRFEPVSLPETRSESAVPELGSRDGGLWVHTGSRWRKYRDGQWQGPAVELADVKTAVLVLGEDRWGRLMLGGHYPEGLFLTGADGSRLHLTQANGLPGNIVMCYLADREGNEWLGLADGGLARLRPRLFELLPGASTQSSAPALALCQTHDGAVWMGTSLAGIYRYLGGEVTHYSAKDFPLTHTLSILEDRRSNVWFGTSWYGVYQFQSNRFVQVFKQSELPGRVNVIYETPDQALWFGCGSGLVSCRQGQLQAQVFGARTAGVQVRALAADGHGGLWVGTGNCGLWCWKESRLTPVLTNGLAQNPLWSLYVDRNNGLWIGTQGGGLGWLREGQLVSFTSANGLWDDTITHIAEDGHGQFWLGSQHGVFRVARQELEAFALGRSEKIASVGYGQSDGMPSTECQGGFQPSGCTTRDGRMLFPTLKGAAALNPGSVRVNPQAPPVFIEEVLLDGENAARPAAGGKLVVPPDKGRLEIQFTALSFTDPKKVRFQCRLEGMERRWEELGPERSVNYSYLRPGEYGFHVRACNNDGVWNRQGASLRLKVLPHWWETWWFIGTLLAGGGGGIAATVRRREKQKARRKLERLQQEQVVEKERARIAKDIHDDLGASLTRMTVLTELVKADKQQPEQVEAHAERIGAAADEAVKSLDAIVWAVNPRNDTLDSLLQYLSHYAYDFFQQTAVECQLDLPPEVPPIPLRAEVRHNLFLAVKEALNNALKHSGASAVSLRVSLREGELEIRIADNGRGFEKAAAGPARSGLGNMRQRLAALGGTLQLESEPGNGTTVVVKLHLHAGAESAGLRHNGEDGTSA